MDERTHQILKLLWSSVARLSTTWMHYLSAPTKCETPLVLLHVLWNVRSKVYGQMSTVLDPRFLFATSILWSHLSVAFSGQRIWNFVHDPDLLIDWNNKWPTHSHMFCWVSPKPGLGTTLLKNNILYNRVFRKVLKLAPNSPVSIETLQIMQ